MITSGKAAAHSSSTSLSIWSKSSKKDAAFSFIEWMCGIEGQSVRASLGYIPNQKSLGNKYLESVSYPKNIKTFMDAAEYETPGDWWYMPDKTWIDEWANALNTKVRNGTMTLDTFFSVYIEKANEALKRYKK